jgi:hypothetical protein
VARGDRKARRAKAGDRGRRVVILQRAAGGVKGGGPEGFSETPG